MCVWGGGGEDGDGGRGDCVFVKGRKRNKAILMYRILNNQGASSLKESFTRISALEINYNLRNSSTELVLPHPKREFLKGSFKFSGAKLWNSLPLQAKLAQSEYTFKMNINSLDT